MTEATSTYTCRWCRETSDGTSRTCPICGAPVDVSDVTTESGWQELPPIPDMARLQFGASTCQIEGTYVPVADVKLAEGDTIEFSHHVLLWQDESVTLEALPVEDAVNRVRAGIPLVLMSAAGPGHVALSDDKPGEIVALPLEAGAYVDAHAGRFLLATGGVSYTPVGSGIFFVTQSGDDSDPHYPVGRYLDHFVAESGRGLVLLHAAGNTFTRTLEVGQEILVHPSALLFKDPGVEMSLHIEWPAYEPGSSTIFKGKYRSIWLRLTGPGRVAVQSVFERSEDNGNTITRSSGYSSQRW